MAKRSQRGELLRSPRFSRASISGTPPPPTEDPSLISHHSAALRRPAFAYKMCQPIGHLHVVIYPFASCCGLSTIIAPASPGTSRSSATTTPRCGRLYLSSLSCVSLSVYSPIPFSPLLLSTLNPNIIIGRNGPSPGRIPSRPPPKVSPAHQPAYQPQQLCTPHIWNLVGRLIICIILLCITS